MTMSNPTISDQKTTIDIMLVSHTNVGKTTLIRTLLGQDVGEVLDAGRNKRRYLLRSSN